MKLRKIHPELIKLSEILDEEKFNNFITATKSLGTAQSMKKTLLHPATPEAVGCLVKDVAEVYYIELGSNPQHKEERERINGFIKKYEVMWHRVLGNTIAESQATIKRAKVMELPNIADTILCRKYFLKQMKYASRKIQTS